MLMPGDKLALLDGGQQTNEYYHVAVPGTDVPGWVSRYMVRCY